jgi:DNA-binding response OmpR family regulator
MGEVPVKVPRDRNGKIESDLVPKYSRTVNGFDEKVISMYSLGLSDKDIQEQIKDIEKKEAYMSKILIVEDEKPISELIQDTLSLGKHETDCAFDGLSALEKIEMNHYDLILLDIMLPKLTGFEVLEKIKYRNIPVIFLSARQEVENIVKGLKNGAQDYLTKPFEPLELLARIELRLAKTEISYQYKTLNIDLDKREVRQNTTEITLSPKEFDLFVFFLKHLGETLTRERLLHEVWEIDTKLETRTIDYHIQQLRKKLNLKNEIVTINKIGYRLEKENEI